MGGGKQGNVGVDSLQLEIAGHRRQIHLPKSSPTNRGDIPHLCIYFFSSEFFYLIVRFFYLVTEKHFCRELQGPNSTFLHLFPFFFHHLGFDEHRTSRTGELHPKIARCASAQGTPSCFSFSGDTRNDQGQILGQFPPVNSHFAPVLLL